MDFFRLELEEIPKRWKVNLGTLATLLGYSKPHLYGIANGHQRTCDVLLRAIVRRVTDEDEKSFGTWQRDRRAEAGWTQQDLAAITEVALNDIGRIERGELVPDLALRAKIARAFGPRLRRQPMGLGAKITKKGPLPEGDFPNWARHNREIRKWTPEKAAELLDITVKALLACESGEATVSDSLKARWENLFRSFPLIGADINHLKNSERLSLEELADYLEITEDRAQRYLENHPVFQEDAHVLKLVREPNIEKLRLIRAEPPSPMASSPASTLSPKTLRFVDGLKIFLRNGLITPDDVIEIGGQKVNLLRALARAGVDSGRMTESEAVKLWLGDAGVGR